MASTTPKSCRNSWTSKSAGEHPPTHQTPLSACRVVSCVRFIERYVLCPNCGLPEIDLSIKKGTITYKCNACGNAGNGDNVHKLATFILKNPPDGSESTTGKKTYVLTHTP